MPITNSGYTPETEAQSRTRIIQEVKDNLGNDAIVDRPGGILSSIVNVEVQEAQTFDSNLGDAFQQLQIDTATGQNLDQIGEQQAIVRLTSTFSTVLVTFTGVSGTIIPAAFLVSTSSNLPFQTLNQDTISDTGSVDINCQCLQAGADGNVPIGTINSIPTPLEGLESVNNGVAAIGGGEAETDDAYRARIKSGQGVNVGTSNIISQQLSLVAGVQFVNYRENVTYDTVDTMPPLSVQFLLSGGASDDIWTVFKNYGAVPFNTFGEQSVTKPNEYGRDITYYFSRPITINLLVKVIITGTVSDNFKTLLTAQIQSFIGGRNSSLSLSGSEVLAGVTEEFITNNQSQWNNISLIKITLKRDTGLQYTDSVNFDFVEYPQVKEVIYA